LPEGDYRRKRRAIRDALAEAGLASAWTGSSPRSWAAERVYGRAAAVYAGGLGRTGGGGAMTTNERTGRAGPGRPARLHGPT
jgi:hypothetical protein